MFSSEYDLQTQLYLTPGQVAQLRTLRADGQVEQAGQVKQELVQVLRRIDTVSRNGFAALRLNNEGANLDRTILF